MRGRQSRPLSQDGCTSFGIAIVILIAGAPSGGGAIREISLVGVVMKSFVDAKTRGFAIRAQSRIGHGNESCRPAVVEIMGAASFRRVAAPMRHYEVTSIAPVMPKRS